MIQAIETRYNGYRFRSRLEARWAVFFDTLGIKYEYEREGYDLSHLVQPDFGYTDSGAPGEDAEEIYKGWRDDVGNGSARYLPDFWLPHLNAWVEIKGQEPNKREEALAEMLAFTAMHDIFIFYGDITIPDPMDYGSTPSYKYFAGGGCDQPYFWCECGSCGFVGIEFDGRSDRLPCKECYHCAAVRSGWKIACEKHLNKPPTGCPRSGGNLDKGYNADSPRLIAAYTAARSARFEFGENGR